MYMNRSEEKEKRICRGQLIVFNPLHSPLTCRSLLIVVGVDGMNSGVAASTMGAMARVVHWLIVLGVRLIGNVLRASLLHLLPEHMDLVLKLGVLLLQIAAFLRVRLEVFNILNG